MQSSVTMPLRDYDSLRDTIRTTEEQLAQALRREQTLRDRLADRSEWLKHAFPPDVLPAEILIGPDNGLRKRIRITWDAEKRIHLVTEDST